MKVLRLKEYRKMNNLSQTDVANRINVTQSYYSLWELGKRIPDAKQLLELCKVFKCTPNDLYGIQGDYIIGMDNVIINK